MKRPLAFVVTLCLAAPGPAIANGAAKIVTADAPATIALPSPTLAPTPIVGVDQAIRPDAGLTPIAVSPTIAPSETAPAKTSARAQIEAVGRNIAAQKTAPEAALNMTFAGQLPAPNADIPEAAVPLALSFPNLSTTPS